MNIRLNIEKDLGIKDEDKMADKVKELVEQALNIKTKVTLIANNYNVIWEIYEVKK